jgi:hypothetical protein
MMRFLTRQVAVDAILWDGKEETFDDIVAMVGDGYEISVIDSGSKLIQMDTEMGVAYPEPGEWIVWDGEFAQAYKDARFRELFELAVEVKLQFGEGDFLGTVTAPLGGARYVSLHSINPHAAISPVPKTQEEKVAFRQEWDARVDKGKEQQDNDKFKQILKSAHENTKDGFA